MISGQVRFHDSLEPLLVDIDSVQQHDRNYNGGDVEKIAESILTVGMYRPIIVEKETRKILAGNHTWEACKSLGATQIPIVEFDSVHGEATDALKAMIGDNRIAALARPDNWQLVALLSELSLNHDLVGTGYDEYDLEVLAHLNDIPADTLDFAQWPTITVQVPPHVKKAYQRMTREADDDRERFELLLRLAGWDGT